MGWKIDDGGFGIVLAQSLPPFAEKELGPAVTGILARNGLRVEDIGRFICHPGGMADLVGENACYHLIIATRQFDQLVGEDDIAVWKREGIGTDETAIAKIQLIVADTAFGIGGHPPKVVDDFRLPDFRDAA